LFAIEENSLKTLIDNINLEINSTSRLNTYYVDEAKSFIKEIKEKHNLFYDKATKQYKKNDELKDYISNKISEYKDKFNIFNQIQSRFTQEKSRQSSQLYKAFTDEIEKLGRSIASLFVQDDAKTGNKKFKNSFLTGGVFSKSLISRNFIYVTTLQEEINNDLNNTTTSINLKQQFENIKNSFSALMDQKSQEQDFVKKLNNQSFLLLFLEIMEKESLKVTRLEDRNNNSYYNFTETDDLDKLTKTQTAKQPIINKFLGFDNNQTLISSKYLLDLVLMTLNNIEFDQNDSINIKQFTQTNQFVKTFDNLKNKLDQQVIKLKKQFSTTDYGLIHEQLLLDYNKIKNSIETIDVNNVDFNNIKTIEKEIDETINNIDNAVRCCEFYNLKNSTMEDFADDIADKIINPNPQDQQYKKIQDMIFHSTQQKTTEKDIFDEIQIAINNTYQGYFKGHLLITEDFFKTTKNKQFIFSVILDAVNNAVNKKIALTTNTSQKNPSNPRITNRTILTNTRWYKKIINEFMTTQSKTLSDTTIKNALSDAENKNSKITEKDVQTFTTNKKQYDLFFQKQLNTKGKNKMSDLLEYINIK